MTVIINGDETSVVDGQTVLGLLKAKDVSPDTVVVELNGEILPGDSLAETVLQDGDHLEVLRFVGGG